MNSEREIVKRLLEGKKVEESIQLTSNFDKKFMKALSDKGVGPVYNKIGDKIKSTKTGAEGIIKGFYVDMLGKPKVRIEYKDNGRTETLDYFVDEFKKDLASGIIKSN